MKPFRGMSLFALSLLLISGCADKPTQNEPVASQAKNTEKSTETPKATVPESEVKLAESLKTLGAKLKQDQAGYVIEVDFRGTKIDDAALKEIAGLSHLRSLLLNETPITDAAFESVGKVTTLENLDLRNCSLNNKAISYLTGLSKLKALRLSGNSDIDDDAMADINQLTNLKALMLDFLWVSGDGLSQLKDLNKLEELYLAKTLVDDDGLATLTQFPKLKKTRLSQNQISDEGLAVFDEIASPPASRDSCSKTASWLNNCGAVICFSSLEAPATVRPRVSSARIAASRYPVRTRELPYSTEPRIQASRIAVIKSGDKAGGRAFPVLNRSIEEVNSCNTRAGLTSNCLKIMVRSVSGSSTSL